uniref:SWIM-type domain-containing protein n=1 Tax=Panagrolaimus superbus TaxID=310955 RepID=A0A914YJN5_9BILA
MICHEAMADHIKISSNDMNQHTVNIKGQDPHLVFKKKNRNGETWSCTCRSTTKCSHVLIVMKHMEEEMYYDDDGSTGDLLIDEKNTKGSTRSGRKRPRPEDVPKSDNLRAIKQVKPEKLSVNQPVIDGEKKGQELLMTERNELHKRTMDIPASEIWVNAVLFPFVIGKSIFYHNFKDPLPVLKHGDIILGVTPRGTYHLITRNVDEVQVVLLINQIATDSEVLQDNTLADKRLQYLGGIFAFCARDVSNKKVKVKILLHDNSNDLNRHGKLYYLPAL